ncbi:MurR/RpiR family transcriptional regulator [Sinorhizobium mexicanum]|uniref:MurR/RpiR family transcriptional regulator n=1 Tax=Sinorhizobium mexicanum TaxID=375549 RepID=A0A859QL38_9HYPH|nr:MurR/RpiR family transcriptional regulator [Sinorhizobium mexicanum]MBP1886388.1 DNA-binding MurR/RpiR family transcriptional regulator [Sinorhizobium mexicanum]QLL64015.1 MurR/RpiR family transcriptional regulator [Sinorhizobium mexicanum]
MEATDRTSQVLKEHFDRHRSSLSRSELAVAEHLLTMPIDVLIFRSAEEIAVETGTSDATVIRTAKRLGFSGLPQLKRICSRVMAKTTPAVNRLEQRFRATGDDLVRVAGQIFSEACEALTSTKDEIDEQSLYCAVGIIEESDTVWCLGMGTSETPARHCATALRRVGMRTRCSGASGFTLANELIDLRQKDVVVLFHALRDVAELKLIVDQISAIGCKVILVCGVQLREAYRGKVSAVLTCLGVRSKLASWNLSAIAIADILAYSVAVRNREQALAAKKRLADLRSRVGIAD